MSLGLRHEGMGDPAQVHGPKWFRAGDKLGRGRSDELLGQRCHWLQRGQEWESRVTVRGQGAARGDHVEPGSTF